MKNIHDRSNYMTQKINNKNNPNYRRPRISYFTKAEQEYGKSWLANKQLDQIKYDAKIIIRDIVKQNVDLEQHSHYFNELAIINSVLAEVRRQYNKNSIIHDALMYHINNLQLHNYVITDMYIMVEEEIRCLCAAYGYMLNAFTNISQGGEARANLEWLYSQLIYSNAKAYLEDDSVTKAVTEGLELDERWKAYYENGGH